MAKNTDDNKSKAPGLSAKKVELLGRIAAFLGAAITKETTTVWIDAMHAGRKAQIESYRLFIGVYQSLCAEFHLRTNSASWTEYMTPYLQELTGKAKGFSYPSMIAYKALCEDESKAEAWIAGDYDLSSARLKENQKAFSAETALNSLMVQVTNTINKVIEETGQTVKLVINTAGDGLSYHLIAPVTTETE